MAARHISVKSKHNISKPKKKPLLSFISVLLSLRQIYFLEGYLLNNITHDFCCHDWLTDSIMCFTKA